jgi:hypothetical protein
LSRELKIARLSSFPLFLILLKEPLRPNKFNCQHAESGENQNRSRARSYEHYDATKEQRQAEHQGDEPTRLTNCFWPRSIPVQTDYFGSSRMLYFS